MDPIFDPIDHETETVLMRVVLRKKERGELLLPSLGLLRFLSSFLN